ISAKLVGKGALCALLLIMSNLAYGQPQHQCSSAATQQAKKLLAFHFGRDDRMEIDKNVKRLAPIHNPANNEQLFDVLEVWGDIYTVEHRWCFIYARLPGKCVLRGKEILEYASL